MSIHSLSAAVWPRSSENLSHPEKKKGRDQYFLPPHKVTSTYIARMMRLR